MILALTMLTVKHYTVGMKDEAKSRKPIDLGRLDQLVAVYPDIVGSEVDEDPFVGL